MYMTQRKRGENVSDQEKRIDELEKRIDELEKHLSIVIHRQLKLESKVTALYEYVKTQKDCLSGTIDVLSGLIKSLTK